MTRRLRATAIVNPQTGRRGPDALAEMLRATLERRYALTIAETRHPNEAPALARAAAQDSDILIAVGGDGTVADVASGLLGTEAALAIVPTGSTNVIARGLGIPLNPRSAARLLLRPTERRRLDVALGGKRVMLHMAGCGFDALMMRDARRSLKRVAAWLAYVPPALKHLAGQPWNFEITLDGKTMTVDARMVLVANGSFVLGRWFEVGEDIRPDDGLLDVIIFSPRRPHEVATLCLWAALGQTARSRHVRQLRGTHVRIDATPSAPTELDGDYVGSTPLELRIEPAALQVIVPASDPHGKADDLVDEESLSNEPDRRLLHW